MMSNLLFSCLAMSRVMRATKQVICMRKSMMMARPAFRANELTAGMSDRVPRKKQVASDTEESSIEGPTSPTCDRER